MSKQPEITPVDRPHIWIEFENPAKYTDAQCHRRAELANVMLARLNGGTPPTSTFAFNEKRRLYEYGNPMGIAILLDHAAKFNLEYLGRPL